jgi:hypothetical protein
MPYVDSNAFSWQGAYALCGQSRILLARALCPVWTVTHFLGKGLNPRQFCSACSILHVPLSCWRLTADRMTSCRLSCSKPVFYPLYLPSFVCFTPVFSVPHSYICISNCIFLLDIPAAFLMFIPCIFVLCLQTTNKCTDLLVYHFILPLLHVSTRVCHHQGALPCLLSYMRIECNGW